MSDIKLICFDLDKTLIIEHSWYELNKALGVTHEEDSELFKQYSNGEITYDEWNYLLLKLFQERGKPTLQNITEILSRYTYRDGAKDLVDYLRNKGYKIALLSGSIDILVDMVAHDLEIKLAEANNTFIFDENSYLVDIKSFGVDTLAKLHHLESFARKLGIDITECACIGDGDNDIEMFKATKHGITFNDSAIKDEAWKVIDTFEDIKKIF